MEWYRHQAYLAVRDQGRHTLITRKTSSDETSWNVKTCRVKTFAPSARFSTVISRFQLGGWTRCGARAAPRARSFHFHIPRPARISWRTEWLLSARGVSLCPHRSVALSTMYLIVIRRSPFYYLVWIVRADASQFGRVGHSEQPGSRSDEGKHRNGCSSADPFIRPSIPQTVLTGMAKQMRPNLPGADLRICPRGPMQVQCSLAHGMWEDEALQTRSPLVQPAPD